MALVALPDLAAALPEVLGGILEVEVLRRRGCSSWRTEVGKIWDLNDHFKSACDYIYSFVRLFSEFEALRNQLLRPVLEVSA